MGVTCNCGNGSAAATHYLSRRADHDHRGLFQDRLSAAALVSREPHDVNAFR